MKRFLKGLFIFVTIVGVIAGAAYVITRFVLATDELSGTDDDTRHVFKHEPVKRRYTSLELPD